MIAPHLRHTYATLAPHTLANFQSLPKLISCLAGASFPSLAQACSLCPIPPNAYPSSHTRLCQLADFPSSHTRLRQLADFPSLNLRSTFAQPSLNLRSTFAYDCATQSLSEKFCFVRAICQSPLQCE